MEQFSELFGCKARDVGAELKDKKQFWNLIKSDFCVFSIIQSAQHKFRDRRVAQLCLWFRCSRGVAIMLSHVSVSITANLVERICHSSPL